MVRRCVDLARRLPSATATRDERRIGAPTHLDQTATELGSPPCGHCDRPIAYGALIARQSAIISWAFASSCDHPYGVQQQASVDSPASLRLFSSEAHQLLGTFLIEGSVILTSYAPLVGREPSVAQRRCRRYPCIETCTVKLIDVSVKETPSPPRHVGRHEQWFVLDDGFELGIAEPLVTAATGHEHADGRV